MSEMQELLGGLLDVLLALFPQSPFAPFIDSLEQLPYLGYLNWFVPVGGMLAVGTAWLAAIAVYYLYSVLARWIKLIS